VFMVGWKSGFSRRASRAPVISTISIVPDHTDLNPVSYYIMPRQLMSSPFPLVEREKKGTACRVAKSRLVDFNRACFELGDFGYGVESGYGQGVGGVFFEVEGEEHCAGRDSVGDVGGHLDSAAT